MSPARRTLAFAVVGGISLGCGSASQNCRIGAAFQTDPIARQLALSRCEQVENREYAESVRQDEHARAAAEDRRRALAEDRRDRAEARSRREQSDRAVRANPHPPELGATAKESASVCKQQQGRQIESTTAGRKIISCLVGDVAIYKGVLGADESLVDIRVFLEGGDVAKTREAVEAQHGPATRTGVKDGYRFWLWQSEGARILVSSYDGGVSVSSGSTAAPESAANNASVRQGSGEARRPPEETERNATAAKCSLARPCPTGLQCDFGQGVCAMPKSANVAPERAAESSAPECSLARPCPPGSQCNFGTGQCIR